VACFLTCPCTSHQDDDVHACWLNFNADICIFDFVECRAWGALPAGRLLPVCVCMCLCIIIRFAYSAFPGDGKADSRHGPRLPQAEEQTINWGPQFLLHHSLQSVWMKLNIWSCSLWWEMKLNGTHMLGGLELCCLAVRRHLVDRFKWLWELIAILQFLCLCRCLMPKCWLVISCVWLFMSFFMFPSVLHPASNQLVGSMPDGVRVTFSRPSRPPNIPSPPPLIPTTKPTDKPSFIQGGSISQVRNDGIHSKVETNQCRQM